MPDFSNSATVVTKLLELAQADARYLQELERFRRAVVVMFTDIQGSTAYFEKYGDAAGLLMVHQCNDTIRRVAEKYRGRVIKSIGDGMMTTFPQPRAAVEAAIDMQTTLAEVNSVRPESERVAVRIGLHYGTGIVRTNDVFGDVVNVASRVESVAAPGQIVVSDALCELVREHGFEIRGMGRFALKGKAGERDLFQVIWNKTAQEGKPSSATAPENPITRFKLQLVHKDGSLGEQYPLDSQLTVGRLQGDLRFATDPNMAPLNARVFLKERQLYVEDLSGGSEGVFIRLAGGHTLQNQDIVIMGQQLFRFQEAPEAMSAVTRIGATLVDINNALGEVAAGLVRLDPDGKPAGNYPLDAVEVQFGRTRGRYRFPEDRLMSRVHARILQRGEDFLLEDAGSRNGTFVRLRDRAQLQPGSAVLVGSQLLRVVVA